MCEVEGEGRRDTEGNKHVAKCKKKNIFVVFLK